LCCKVASSFGDQEIHIDGAWGLTYTAGTCKINWYTVAPVSDDQIERREVAVRITMGAPTLFALRGLLETQSKSLEERGVVMLIEASDDEAADKTGDGGRSES
jgi:hypothetical protein